MFIMCWFTLYPNKTYALDYENGHFEIIHTNISPDGCPLKLNDGRILILDIDENYIFNPDDNTLKKTVNLPFGFSYIGNGRYFPATVLNDGTVFIIGHILDVPSEKFQSELNAPINNILRRNELRTNQAIVSLSTTERNLVINSRWKDYRKLSEKQKEKLYMPIIKNNADLLRRYTEYCAQRERSKYALLFNPINEKFEFLDKLELMSSSSTSLIPVTKSDSEVLIFTITGEIVLYDIKNHFLKKIQSNQGFYYIKNIIPLDNQKYIILLPESKYTIYDSKTNTYSNIVELPFPKYKISEIIKLDNENLILFTDIEEQGIYIYNIKSRKYKYITKFSFARYLYWDQPIRPLLIDDKIFIFGGLDKNCNSNVFGFKSIISNKLEIINLRTRTSKFIKMKYVHGGNRSVLLNDGRILIYGGKNNELYVPKGYKKRSKLWSQN